MTTINIKRSEMRSFSNYFLQGLFNLFYGFLKYIPIPIIGNILRYICLKIFMGSKIKSANINEMVTFFFPWRTSIGRKSSINQGVIIDGTGSVKIGNGVRVAPNVYFNTADHEFENQDTWIINQGFIIGPIIIEDDVWIGTGVIVNKNITIGKGSIIGAGSVVTKSIPPYSIAVGVPCKVIRKRRI